MNETTHSLAHYGWAALKWESYYLHVLATTDRRSKERPRVPGPITFFTYWRCVTYLVCLILLNIVFQAGATALSLAMVRISTPGDALLPSHDKQTLSLLDEDLLPGHSATPVVNTTDARPPVQRRSSIAAKEEEATTSPSPVPLVGLNDWIRVLPYAWTHYLLLFTWFLSIDRFKGLQSTLSRTVLYMISSALFAPRHALWTHAMICRKSTNTISHRLNDLTPQYIPLILPSLLYSGAQALLVVVPISMIQHFDWQVGGWAFALRLLAIPLAAMALTVCPLLPAGMVLARVESAILPESEVALTACYRDCDIAVGDGPRTFYARWMAPTVRALGSLEIVRLQKVVLLYTYWVIALVAASCVHQM